MKAAIISAIAFVLVLWGLVHFSLYGWHVQTGQGEHTGYVTAVEQTGIWFKTYTAYVKTDTQSSQEDEYCVIDSQVFGLLKVAAESKVHVTVSYIDYLAKGLANCNGEPAGIIVGVKQEN